jgi:hypothetical protein
MNFSDTPVGRVSADQLSPDQLQTLNAVPEKKRLFLQAAIPIEDVVGGPGYTPSTLIKPQTSEQAAYNEQYGKQSVAQYLAGKIAQASRQFNLSPQETQQAMQSYEAKYGVPVTQMPAAQEALATRALGAGSPQDQGVMGAQQMPGQGQAGAPKVRATMFSTVIKDGQPIVHPKAVPIYQSLLQFVSANPNDPETATAKAVMGNITGDTADTQIDPAKVSALAQKVPSLGPLLPSIQQHAQSAQQAATPQGQELANLQARQQAINAGLVPLGTERGKLESELVKAGLEKQQALTYAVPKGSSAALLKQMDAEKLKEALLNPKEGDAVWDVIDAAETGRIPTLAGVYSTFPGGMGTNAEIRSLAFHAISQLARQRGHVYNPSDKEIAFKENLSSGVTSANQAVGAEKDLRNDLVKVAFNSQGPAGIQAKKVDAAVHAGALLNDPNTIYSKGVEADLVQSLATLLGAGANTSDAQRRDLVSNSAFGDLMQKLSYAEGKPLDVVPAGYIKQFKDMIKRQGEYSEDLRDGYLSQVKQSYYNRLSPEAWNRVKDIKIGTSFRDFEKDWGWDVSEPMSAPKPEESSAPTRFTGNRAADLKRKAAGKPVAPTMAPGKKYYNPKTQQLQDTPVTE